MKKMMLCVVVALTLWGCVTFSQSYKLGTKAAINKNWDEAVEYYEKAVWESPKNSVYRLALFRAKTAASLHYLQEARKLVAQGMKEEAFEQYKKALSYDPLNRVIAEEVRLLRKEEIKEEEKPAERRIEPPFKLKTPKEKVQLKFVSASLRSIFQALGKFAQANILFDEQFRDMPFSIDLIDMDFDQAIGALCLASKNFYRVIDEKTLIVAADQPLKRAQYELNAIRTFYLSNINAQELQGPLAQMLRTQFKAPSIIIDKNLNSLTIRDTPSNIELAEKLLKVWDKSKGEVVIDLEIMEVSRIKLQQIGLDFDHHIVGLSYNNTDEKGWINLKDLDFSKVENFSIGLPLSFIQFLESDTDTKIIAQPRLRGVESEDIRYLVGDKIPIPRTTFTPIAAGGISQQPVTSFEYQDVGIDIKIKPKIHFENEVTLELEIKITSLGGKGYADIPIISTREVKNVIRLKDGETNLLAGLLRDEERKTLKGIAGLKSIPLLGSLFSNTDKSITQTDVILTITPYIIRSIPLNKGDLDPLWIDLEGVTPVTGTPSPVPEEESLERRLRQERAQEEEMRREDEPQNQIFLTPADFQTSKNREFRISLIMRSQQEIGNFSLSINFNAQMLELKDVIAGSMITQLGDKVPFLKNIDNSSGVATIGFSSPDLSRGAKGGGRVATLVFQAVGDGDGVISLSSATANSPTGAAVSFTTNECHVVVR